MRLIFTVTLPAREALPVELVNKLESVIVPARQVKYGYVGFKTTFATVPPSAVAPKAAVKLFSTIPGVEVLKTAVSKAYVGAALVAVAAPQVAVNLVAEPPVKVIRAMSTVEVFPV